jgi:hypothetical protein
MLPQLLGSIHLCIYLHIYGYRMTYMMHGKGGSSPPRYTVTPSDTQWTVLVTVTDTCGLCIVP